MLRLVTGPTETLVTMAQARRHLVDTPAEDDELIQDLILVATADREEYTGRKLLPQTWEWVLDAFPTRAKPIKFPTGPVQEVDSVTYYDTDDAAQTLTLEAGPTPGDLIFTPEAGIHPARLAPTPGTLWPSTSARIGAIVVRFLAGYTSAAAVPAQIVQSVLLKLGEFYEHREAGLVGVSYMSMPTADNLVRPYVFGVGIA